MKKAILLFISIMSAACANEYTQKDPQSFELHDEFEKNGVDMVGAVPVPDMGEEVVAGPPIDSCDHMVEPHKLDIDGKHFVLHDQSSAIHAESECAWPHYKLSNISYSHRHYLSFFSVVYNPTGRPPTPELFTRHYQQQSLDVGKYLETQETGYEGGRVWLSLDEPVFIRDDERHAFECIKSEGAPKQFYVFDEHYIVCDMNTPYGFTLNSPLGSPGATKVWNKFNYILGHMTPEQNSLCIKNTMECPPEIAWKGHLIYIKDGKYKVSKLSGSYLPYAVYSYSTDSQMVEMADRQGDTVTYSTGPRPLFNFMYNFSGYIKN